MSELPPTPLSYEEIWTELDAIEVRKEFLLKLLILIDRIPDANT